MQKFGLASSRNSVNVIIFSRYYLPSAPMMFYLIVNTPISTDEIFIVFVFFADDP